MNTLKIRLGRVNVISQLISRNKKRDRLRWPIPFIKYSIILILDLQNRDLLPTFLLTSLPCPFHASGFYVFPSNP